MLRGKGEGEQAAHVACDQGGLLDVERVEYARYIARLCLLVVAAVGFRGEAEAAQVGSDYSVGLGQRRR